MGVAKNFAIIKIAFTLRPLAIITIVLNELVCVLSLMSLSLIAKSLHNQHQQTPIKYLSAFEDV